MEPQKAIFSRKSKKKKRKNALLNILEPLISLKMCFQVFQGVKRTNKLFFKTNDIFLMDLLIVQFLHFSVKEFLTMDQLAKPIRDILCYHIQLKAVYTILVQACLGILLQLDNHINCCNIESFPLAQYATQYWATHAQIENVLSHIKEGMECLFNADKPHFATWLWIYNED
jgi:hypothetical protein